MSLDRYHQLTSQAEEAFVGGDGTLALSLLEQAEQQAAQLDELDLVNQAFCRQCYVAIEFDDLGHTVDVARLKQILLASDNLTTRWMAAHYVSLASVMLGEKEQALTYGERSLAIAEELGDSSRAAASTNLFGTLAAQASRFDDAEQALRSALTQYVTGDSDYSLLMQAQIRDNLGYVLMCTDRLGQGIDLCSQALHTIEQLDAEHYLPQVLQDLCFGHLMDDDLETAGSLGERGLELARSYNDVLVAKNLLYLLAETWVRAGDRFRARRFLSELTQYYPEIGQSEEVIDLLMETDFTQVVNLRG